MAQRMVELLTPIAQTYELKGLWPIRTMDIRSRYIVYGFARRECKELIPDDVLHIILIFFYYVQDSFTLHGSDIATDIVNIWSENDDILKNYKTRIIHLGGSSSEYNTAYGKVLIDPFDYMIYKWTFRIHRSNGQSFIGIDTGYKDSEVLDEPFVGVDNVHEMYGISSSGIRYSHFSSQLVSVENEERRFTSGDKVCLIVDFSEEYGSMSVSINGSKYMKVFRMMHKSKHTLPYRLAVSLGVGSYIELVNHCFSADGELDLYGF